MATEAPTSRREAIAEAALEAFLEHGVVGASIEEVCRRSGASVGSLYHHFGGKEGLAGAVYAEALGCFQDAFTAELRRHGAAEGGVRGGVRVHLRWCLRDEPRAARFLLFGGDVARGAAAEALRERNRAFFADVLAWWRPHARYGAVRDLAPDLVAALWLGPAEQYCRNRLAGRTAVAPSRAQPVLADGAWQSLRSQGG
jgi:AcrR family transcriptional regulator